LKSKKLLCKKCNDEFGNTIDSELFLHLEPTAHLLNVKRDRKKKKRPIEGVTESERPFFLGVGFGETFMINYVISDGKQIFCSFNSKAEALKFVKKKLKEFKKKMPDLDIERELENFKFETKREEELVFFANKYGTNSKESGFGGNHFYKAYVKIAVNFYYFHTLDVFHVKEALDCLKGDPNRKVINYFYYPENPPNKLGINEVSHLIHLKGDSQNKFLYCYIELFSAHNVLVMLNFEYQGEEFEHTYCYDLLLKKTIKKKIQINEDRRFLWDFPFEGKGEEIRKRHKEKYHRLMKVLERKQLEFI
jgi:hypothetical protein